MHELTINCFKDQIYIGAIEKKYISIYTLNSDHLKTIPVKVKPYFIANTQVGNIIVSPNTQGQGVQVIAPDGELLHTIDALKGVSTWRPVGVCCNLFNNIYIFNSGNAVGIYRFKSSGQYVEFVNKDTKYDDMYQG